MDRMNQHIAIYVPSEVNGFPMLDEQSKWTDRLAWALTDLVGGCTVNERCVGYYYSPVRGRIMERINVVSVCLFPEQMAEVLDVIRPLCQQMATDMMQDSVGLRINEDMEFVQACEPDDVEVSQSA